MKIVIISDIHGNFDALSALPESYDELWVLGDLVNYGPQPKEVVDFIRQNATVVVRGNHDHSMADSNDPRCSARFREAAEATRRFSLDQLSAEQKLYLSSLPLQMTLRRAQTRFFLCHATPSDPLYEYRAADSSDWLEECQKLPVDVIAVGHTHIPFVRSFNGQVLVNPGSIGQPKTGSPEACYAVWEDGRLSLRTYRYPIEETVAKIRTMPIARHIRERLIRVLEHGGLPPQ